MKRYRYRTRTVEVVEWTGNNIEAIEKLCPDAIVDGYGKLWIPAIVHRYRVSSPAFIVKDPSNKCPYHAYKPDEFNRIFEEV